jgi:hypothetical protein
MTRRPPRPPRDARLPLTPAAAGDASQLQRAVRLIYAGSLADGRTLEARDGVYAVRLAPPLVASDAGVAIDLSDPRWQLRLSNDAPSAVDAAETAAAGASGLPARADHRHAHAEVPEAGELTAEVPLTLAEGLAWDPASASLSLARHEHVLLRDPAGHGRWSVGADAGETISLSGLVRAVGDGTTTLSPVQELLFSGGGVEVSVSDGGSGVAEVSLSGGDAVRVSAADVSAGYLQSKILDFAGDGDHLPSTIAVEDDGAGEKSIRVKILKADVRSAVGLEGTDHMELWADVGADVDDGERILVYSGDARGRLLHGAFVVGFDETPAEFADAYIATVNRLDRFYGPDFEDSPPDDYVAIHDCTGGLSLVLHSPTGNLYLESCLTAPSWRRQYRLSLTLSPTLSAPTTAWT